MTAVFWREFTSYFISPIGFVYLAVFYILAGYEFAAIILTGSADMSAEFTFLYTVVLLLTPILTMRLMSEDRRQKTDAILFSAPVSLGGVVAGKYFSAVAVYLMGVAVTLLHALTLSFFAVVDWPIILGNVAGLCLMGMASISVCMFISTLTENQIIAAIGGLACMILLLSLNSLAAVVSFAPLHNLLAGFSFYARYYSLTMGLFDVADLFFFFSFAAVFFFLTTRALERRRWHG